MLRHPYYELTKETYLQQKKKLPETILHKTTEELFTTPYSVTIEQVYKVVKYHASFCGIFRYHIENKLTIVLYYAIYMRYTYEELAYLLSLVNELPSYELCYAYLLDYLATPEFDTYLQREIKNLDYHIIFNNEKGI